MSITAHKNTLPFARPISLLARSLFLPGGTHSLPNPNQSAKIRMRLELFQTSIGVSGLRANFAKERGFQSLRSGQLPFTARIE